jgi:hypothetical protein
MTPGRENFWIRILIAFILCLAFFCLGFFCVVFLCVVFFVWDFSCRAWVMTSRGIIASWFLDRFATSSRGSPDENVVVQECEPESSAHREEDWKQLHSALSADDFVQSNSIPPSRHFRWNNKCPIWNLEVWGKQLKEQPRGKQQPADKGQRSPTTVAMNAHSALPEGLLLDSVQRSRLFGLSAAGASFFVFSRGVGKAAQAEVRTRRVWKVLEAPGVEPVF